MESIFLSACQNLDNQTEILKLFTGRVICVALGGWVLLHGLRSLIFKGYERQKLTARASGVVVGNVLKNPFNHDDPSYYRVVEFSTHRQRVIQFECLDIGLPNPHSVGRRVKVCYDPLHPEQAELVHSYWWLPGVFIASAGFLFLAVGLFVIG
jgi:hypothetical protein